MNTVQLIHPIRSVSPQAIEALKSLEQLQSLSNGKIVKRITTTSPIKQFFLNGRQLTVFGPNKRIVVQSSPIHSTDRIPHTRNVSYEMQNFKRQVQDNILLQTVTSKYESSPKLSTPIKHSETQTPTMFNRNSCENISQPREQNEYIKQYQSPQVNLLQKKKLVLNQILQLDNEIKLMQDEEVKMRLDPSRKKSIITPVSIRDSLENKTSESAFMKKLNEWVKKKHKDTTESNQVSVLRECTSKGNLTSKSYQTSKSGNKTTMNNNKWQKRTNVKKQNQQKSMIQMQNNSKSPNQKSNRPNSSELSCWIRGKDVKNSQSPKKNKIKQLLANKLRF